MKMYRGIITGYQLRDFFRWCSGGKPGSVWTAPDGTEFRTLYRLVMDGGENEPLVIKVEIEGK